MKIRKTLPFVICLFVWLSAKSQITITPTVTDQVASQKGTGAISLSVSGGTSPYTYVWSNSATTQNISSLDAGSYTVTVTDASSATATSTATVLYQTNWQNTANVTTTGTSLTKSGGSGTAWDAGASSANYLPPNTDGYIEFRITSSSGSFYMGLSREDYDVDPAKINYSFYCYNNGLRIVEAGDTKYTGTVSSAGDLLRIERSGNSINYYRNGTLLRSVSTLQDIKLVIDESQYTTGSFFYGLRASFGVPFGTYPTVTDIVPDQPYSGAITVNTDGGTSPYTYAWADGPTTGNRTGLAVGTYTVTVTDANSNTVVNTIEVARQVLWTNVANFTATGNRLVKTSASGWDATAFSQNVLKPNADGYVEWTVPNRFQNYDFGFSVADDGIFNGTSLQNSRYGLTVINNGGARISQTAVSIISALQPGDVLRVERTGNQIYYKLNGATMSQETTDPTLALHLRCIGTLQGNYVSDIRTNLNIDFDVYPIVTDITPDQPNSGAIDLNVRGGTAPYTYSWSGGATTATRTGLALGTYTVTVADANGQTVAASIELKSRIEWAASANVTATYNELVKTGGSNGYSDAYAYSLNRLLPNQDGYVEYRLVTKRQDYYMGLNPSNTIAYLQTCRNALYDHNGGGSFDVYESNNYVTGVTTAGPGDVLRVERSGSNILYKVNGATKRTVATDPGLALSIEGFLLYIGTNVDDVKDIRASFGIPYGAYPQLTHVQANHNGTGAITLNVRGGATPYGYAWADGPTTADRTGLNAGTYTVTVTDANGQTFSSSLTLDYEIEWTNVANMTTSDSKLTKSGSTTGPYDAGGSSVNYLPPNTDGYLEFVVLDKLKTYLISLGTKPYDYYYTGVVTGLYIHGSMAYYDNNFYTNGPSVSTGDVIRIERTGSQVAYKINGTTVRTVTVDPSLRLSVLVGLPQLGYQSAGVHTSFPVKYDTYVDIVDQDPVTPNSGSITLHTDGGTAPYAYAWADGATTASRTGLNAGSYTVTVTDAANQIITATYGVGFNVAWDSYTTGLVTTPTSIQRVSGNDWTAGGGSKNYLAPNQDGLVQFEIPKIGGNYVIGLSQAGGTSFSYTGINNSFWVNSNGTIYIYENGTNVYTVGVMVPGDVLSVERSGSNVVYKRNGSTVRTVSTDPTKVLSIYANFYSAAIVYGVSTSLGNITDGNTWYWTGKGSNTNWSNLDNWSRYPGGQAATALPGSGSNVEFDQYGLVDCNLDQDVSVGSLSIKAGYTLTLSLQNHNLAVAGGFTQDGGHFVGGSGSIGIVGTLQLNGGSFVSTSGTMSLSSDLVETASVFQHNSGTVGIAGDATFSCQSELYNLKIDDGKQLTLAGDLTFLNGLDLGDSGLLILSGHTLNVANGANTAIASTGGKIVAEIDDFSGKVAWYIGNDASGNNYVLPFGTATLDNLDLVFSTVEGGTSNTGQTGALVFSTYPTDADNHTLPIGINGLTDANGNDNSHKMINRFWDIENQNYETAPIIAVSLRYGTSDTIGNDSIPPDSLVIESWNGRSWSMNPSEVPTGSLVVVASDFNKYGVLGLVDKNALLTNEEESYFIVDASDNDYSYAVTGVGLSSNFEGGHAEAFYPTIDPVTNYNLINIAITGTSFQGDVDLQFKIGKNSAISGATVAFTNPATSIVQSYPLSKGDLNGNAGNANRLNIHNLVHVTIPRLASGCTNTLSEANTESKNWVYTSSFDGNNSNPVSEVIQYFDRLGRPTQIQQKVISDNNVVANATLYDEFGRSVLKTLSAPLNKTCFGYSSDFLKPGNSLPEYSYGDFDWPNNNGAEGEKYNPITFDNNQLGTLGYYYSNYNQIEPYVPATGLPYSRIEYSDDPLSVVKAQTQVGDEMKLGSGHESRSFIMPSGGELDYVLGYHTSNQVTDNASNPFDITPIAINKSMVALKSISIDPNGKTIISYADLSGKIIATCNSDAGSACISQHVVQTINYSSNRSVDIHVPASKKSTLKLPSSATYQIMDLVTGKILIWSDYYIDGNGYVVFAANTDKPGFYRVSVTNNVDNVQVEYDLDYSNWALSFYDIKGDLRMTIPPKGIDCSLAPSEQGTYTMANKYVYDVYHQMIAKSEPDKGISEFVYDKEGKIRFTQNQVQRENEFFSYVNYDNHGRPIESAEYHTDVTDPVNATISPISAGYAIQPSSWVPNTCLSCGFRVKVNDATPAVYDAQSLPLDGPASFDKTFIAYDEVATDLPTISGGTYVQHNIQGRISKTWNDAITTWYSYDELGRVEWMVQHVNELDKNFTYNYQYDFSGDILQVTYQKETQNSHPSEFFQHHFLYDQDLRLYKVFTSTQFVAYNTADLTQFELDMEAMDASHTNGVKEQAKYMYYQHGALKRKVLDKNLQGIDYVYTINGWLKSINSANGSQTDPGLDGSYSSNPVYVNGKPSTVFSTPDVAKDVFATTLDYFSGDYKRAGTGIQSYAGDMVDATNNSPLNNAGSINPSNPNDFNVVNLYNGLLKSVRWQTNLDQFQASQEGGGLVGDGGPPSGDPPPYQPQYGTGKNMYAFEYDQLYRLSKAVYGLANGGTLNTSATSPVAPTMYVMHDYRADNITYDANGNILTMKTDGQWPSLNRDNLTYHYIAGSNKLDYVTDAVTSSGYDDDFKPGQTASNYVYDDNGRMITDLQKDIDLVYDVSNKVTTVYKHGSTTVKKVSFVYDDAGRRLKKTTYYTSTANGHTEGDPATDTWYLYAAGNVAAIYTSDYDYASQVHHVYDPPNLHQIEVPVYGMGRIGNAMVGYVVVTTTPPPGMLVPARKMDYTYELTDHLGNVRAVIADGLTSRGLAHVLPTITPSVPLCPATA